MTKPKAAIAAVWTYRSSSGESFYETLLYDDWSTSCNCPGWTRRINPDGSRSCKHTRLIDQDPSLADQQASGTNKYAGFYGMVKVKPEITTQIKKPNKPQEPSRPGRTRAFDFDSE